MGFRALATTSAGVAFGMGLPDTAGAVPCDVMLAHIRSIVEATDPPRGAASSARRRESRAKAGSTALPAPSPSPS
jgi:hypothetical protein